MTKKKLRCPKCGSEEFTADVFYNTGVELYENGGFEIVSDKEAMELDTGSIQCLECCEDIPYPLKISGKFIPPAGEKTKKHTKYCTCCGVRTFGEGWENGLCDTCWEKKDETALQRVIEKTDVPQ